MQLPPGLGVKCRQPQPVLPNFPVQTAQTCYWNLFGKLPSPISNSCLLTISITQTRPVPRHATESLPTWVQATRSLSSKRASLGFVESAISQLTIHTGPLSVTRSSSRSSHVANPPSPSQFWELPESSEDVFSLFAPSDIRRTRDNAIENLETLILAVTSRLFILRHHPSFPDEIAPERDALNCIRVLTRVLPYLYEADNLHGWEDRFFWGIRRKRTRQAAIASEVLFDDSDDEAGKPRPSDEFEDVRPLAEELIDTLIDLLFFSDFTVSKQPHGKPKVTYAIWQSGVGCNQTVATTKEFESNRIEVLRLLLTITGQSMYTSPAVLPRNGIRALTYICSCSDKQVVLSVLCSLLNTVRLPKPDMDPTILM